MLAAIPEYLSGLGWAANINHGDRCSASKRNYSLKVVLSVGLAHQHCAYCNLLTRYFKKHHSYMIVFQADTRHDSLQAMQLVIILETLFKSTKNKVKRSLCLWR